MKYKNLEKKIKEWDLPSENIAALEHLIEKNKSSIKNMNINLINFKTYEDLVSALNSLQAMQSTNEVNKIIPKELSDYKNEKTNDLLKILLNYVEEDYVRKLLLKNTEQVSSSEDLEKLIFKEYQLYIDSSKKDIEKKVSNMKLIKTIINDSNLMLLRINDYNSLIQINTSKNWCITQNIKDFEVYLDRYGYFYLLIDYTKENSDKNYMIGFNKGKSFIGFNNNNKIINESYVKDIIGAGYIYIEDDLKKNYKIEPNHDNCHNSFETNRNQKLLDDLDESISRNQNAMKKYLLGSGYGEYIKN